MVPSSNPCGAHAGECGLSSVAPHTEDNRQDNANEHGHTHDGRAADLETQKPSMIRVKATRLYQVLSVSPLQRYGRKCPMTRMLLESMCPPSHETNDH
ncbi:hypothetical protein ElyMa_001470600 [Elysia marginata]|uniref:Uncharacterized protein n=1 Tax=Elysia marginata TaxID=1093978 RepID=A0AAV4J0M0_9GAST|nr:hypothetical protein ElyMa_001470600 [Elysia marginata]